MNIRQNERVSVLFDRLKHEAVIGQLRSCEGVMAQLSRNEAGEIMLDWVNGPLRLLHDPNELLEQVEDEAAAILDQGIHHIIWSGMGGSIQCVKVLLHLGFCHTLAPGRVVIHPLESTDTTALNAIVREIALAKQMELPPRGVPPTSAWIRKLLEDVLLIGVSMSHTSEEPLTHLAWFHELLDEALLSPAKHLCVLTIGDSLLEHTAREHGIRRLPLFVDGRTGIVGRMSAPCTRVFLLPAALHLMGRSRQPGGLREAFQRAWRLHDLDSAQAHPEAHPFVQLACALHLASRNGICRLLLHLPGIWQALLPWIEQLWEQSTGKDGKGVVVFSDQSLSQQVRGSQGEALLRVQVATHTLAQENTEGSSLLHQPYLSNPFPRDPKPAEHDPVSLLAGVAASFLGWQSAMAVYAYLNAIPLSTEPAVERYKSLARRLRANVRDMEQIEHEWPATFRQSRLTLLAPLHAEVFHAASPATVFAHALSQRFREGKIGYLDFTVTGEIPDPLREVLSTHLHQIGNVLLGVPVKLRLAPAAYHISEQSELDGPPDLVSLRLFLRDHDLPLVGTYYTAFLQAQAYATWQAMLERKRPCFLLLADEPHGAAQTLHQFFLQVEQILIEDLKGGRDHADTHQSRCL